METEQFFFNMTPTVLYIPLCIIFVIFVPVKKPVKIAVVRVLSRECCYLGISQDSGNFGSAK